MATRRYMANPEDPAYAVTEAAGLAVVSKNIELTVDWDGLAALNITGQEARLLVLNSLERIQHYIEQTGKFNVVA